MKGNIYKTGSGYRVKFGRKVSRRFKSFELAERFLTGLRYETDTGKFDPRDYRASNPLGYRKQADKWLETKAGLSGSYLANLKRWVEQGGESWGDKTNVKTIGFAQVEDLILGLSVSDKTKADMVACFTQFFKWLNRREGLPVPELPEVRYDLGWRQTISMEVQGKIIDEVKRICPNRRIWIGIKWLATYVAIRPREMWSLRERDINVDGYFVLPPLSTKEGRPKLVPMLDDDRELYRSLPRGLPALPFFRRHKGRGVSKPGERISSRAFYRWWKKACANLGVEGVDLYGGTRHSTVSALGEYFTASEIQQHATQHRTNKAFERYFRSEAKPKREMYEKAVELAKGGPSGKREQINK